MNKSIKFGTDGIRGNASNFPFTKNALITLGYSISQWATLKYKKAPQILIGHDTRESCKNIKAYIEQGLMNFDVKIIDAQVIPTPAICKIINTDKNFDFGVVISASHNKYTDNGIKIVDAKKGKLTVHDEKIIESNFKQNWKNFEHLTIKKNGSIKIWPDAQDYYIKILIEIFKPTFLNNKKIVLDCANGAAYKIAPQIFSIFGAQTICINNSPNGKNINHNCGALHTEMLSKVVIKNNADFGFAFDGDGDRVIAIDKNGDKINGDQILAILTQHPKALNSHSVVGTIMTNLGLDLYLKNNNINLLRTHVGDKYIAQELHKEKLVLGGESSGHIIMTDYLNSGDGIFIALRTLETVILENINKLKQFKNVPQIIVNLPIQKKHALNEKPFAQIIQKYKNILKDGRIIVRYSGTENILRVMAEGNEEELTRNTAIQLAKNLEAELH